MGPGKEEPIPPKVIKAVYRGHQDRFVCRRCGAGITEAHWHYCPNCGQAILHYSYAGAMGWTAEKAGEKWTDIEKKHWEPQS